MPEVRGRMMNDECDDEICVGSKSACFDVLLVGSCLPQLERAIF
jgi:hypothetical protein